MNIWTILGIRETKDNDEIKKAYRKKLSVTNPEDNPEGFMELRAAYEEALRLAVCEEVEQTADTELLARLTEVYKNFQYRIDVSCWEELFDMDEFVSLDTSEEAFMTLMKFLMEHFHLPYRVWKLIVETFDIVERRNELKDALPEHFIDYMIGNSKYDDLLNYDLITGNEENFDEFIDDYYRLDAAIKRRNHKDIEELFGCIEEMNVFHPYVDIQRCKYELIKMCDDAKLSENESVSKYVMENNGDRVCEIYNFATSICDDYPDDTYILIGCGDIALFMERFDEAKEYFDDAGKLSDNHYMVRGKQAELEYALGNYTASRDIYMDLLKVNHYDNGVRAGMMRANAALIEQNKELLIKEADNDRVRFEIAWSYYQMYSFADSIDMLNTISVNDENGFEYYNLMGRNLLCLAEYEKALNCFLKWKELIENLPEDDDSQEIIDKKKRYQYVNFLIGDSYLKLEKYDLAREYINKARSKEHDEIILSFEAMCELEYNDNKPEACLDACDKLLERDDRSYTAYSFMFKSLDKLGYVNETLSACEKAIALYPYVVDPYIVEISIMRKLNQYDTAEKIIERYRMLGINSDQLTYEEARIYESKGDYDKGIKLLVKALNTGSIEESDMQEYYKLYFLLGILYEHKDEKKLAKEAYEHVADMCEDHPSVFGRLGLLYRDVNKFDKALEMYNKQIKNNPQAFYYIQRAIIYNSRMDLDAAETDYIHALKLESDNIFCYSRLGLIYEKKKQLNKALECYKTGYELLDKSSQNNEDKAKQAQLVSCMARVLQELDRYSESEELYIAYFNEFGMDPDTIYDYSILLQRMDRTKEAIQYVMKCINELPYNESVQALMRLLIELYGSDGYIDKAYDAFSIAIEKKPEDVKAYMYMATVFIHNGKTRDANRLIKNAIKSSKNEEFKKGLESRYKEIKKD